MLPEAKEFRFMEKISVLDRNMGISAGGLRWPGARQQPDISVNAKEESSDRFPGLHL